MWCELCLCHQTAVCYECGKRAYREEVSYVSDNPICEGCFEELCFNCEYCGRNYYNEDYGSDGYCRYCADEDKPTVRPDNRRYYIKSRYDLPVGVEIEAEGGDYSCVYDDLAPKGFGVQTDGSLDSSGIEVQVPASNHGNTNGLVKQACQSLKSNGFGVSRRCGLHIHIEYPSRMKTIKRLLLMIYACEPVFHAVNPRSRYNGTYCQALRLAFKVSEILQAKPEDIDKLFYSKKYPTISRFKTVVRKLKKSKWNECRYFGLNLHSLFYQGTVEFRYHAGTISPDKVTRWIDFLKAILRYVKFHYDQQEVLRLMEQPTILSKINYLKEILKLKRSSTDYLISRYIKFYVRNNLR